MLLICLLRCEALLFKCSTNTFSWGGGALALGSHPHLFRRRQYIIHDTLANKVRCIRLYFILRLVSIVLRLVSIILRLVSIILRLVSIVLRLVSIVLRLVSIILRLVSIVVSRNLHFN